MKKHGQCYFLTYVRPQKDFGLIFSIFWPFFRHLPPLFVALSQKVSWETFQNYLISMYNSNTDLLKLILGVEVFFSLGHCSGALCVYNVWGIIYKLRDHNLWHKEAEARHRGGCSIITLGLHDLAKSNQHEHHLCLNVSVSVYLHFSDDGDALMPERLQPE